jgi:hypothetical protein
LASRDPAPSSPSSSLSATLNKIPAERGGVIQRQCYGCAKRSRKARSPRRLRPQQVSKPNAGGREKGDVGRACTADLKRRRRPGSSYSSLCSHKPVGGDVVRRPGNLGIALQRPQGPSHLHERHQHHECTRRVGKALPTSAKRP